MIGLSVSLKHKGSFNNTNQKMKRAVKQATRDAVRALKAEAARAVSAKYWLTQQQVKQYITEQPTGIFVSSQRLSLDKYKLSPKAPIRSKKRYLTAAVERQGGLKPLGKKAFLAPVSGSIKPFARVNKARLPISKLVGPAVPQLVDNPGVIDRIQARGNEVFASRFAHYLSRFGGVQS